ncbi:protein tesmin/TSO1-like CXC 6 [Citrus clementina]|uniref:protein tesmin/TSO1-like CXC 6 n=1 Tax=Citrus clementina TaxID=85681 RepID=UPI000CED1FBE|nr:protein tesmin/TSO1-like CXC 6 [Citrus x clementina]
MKTKYGAPKLQKQCRCKQSRCLKLYCECFAAGAYCDGCGCNCCGNNVENEDLRQDAMESILERNPNAFRPKIGSSRSGAQDVDTPKVGKHNWGCRCKKTKCLKKYCECFHAKVFCSKNCKCVNCKNSEDYVEHETLSGRPYNNSKICNNSEGYENSIVVSGGDNSNTNISKNFEGSEEQKAISSGNHGEANIYKHDENYFRKMCIKQANAAISAAVGLSGPSILQASRKRKLQKILDSNYEDLSIQRLSNHQKVNPFSVSSSLSAWSVDPIDPIDSSATLGSSEFHFSSKPSFTDIIQARDVAELCSTLVLVSEATRIVLGKNDTSYIQAVRGNLTADITEVQDVENFQKGSNVQKETSDDHLSGNKDDFISEGIDLKEGRSSSPETIRLYSETDELSGTSKSDWIPIHGCNGDVHVEQERLVLTIFSDCLKKIILGNLKGKCQHVDYSIVKDGTAT